MLERGWQRHSGSNTQKAAFKLTEPTHLSLIIFGRQSCWSAMSKESNHLKDIFLYIFTFCMLCSKLFYSVSWKTPLTFKQRVVAGHISYQHVAISIWICLKSASFVTQMCFNIAAYEIRLHNQCRHLKEAIIKREDVHSRSIEILVTQLENNPSKWL